MTVRRWLPWIVALAVVAVTTVVVLTVPNRHVCPPATHPIQAVRFGLLPIDARPTAWVCASDDSATLVSELGVDRRIPVRLGIALVGVALGVAMGFALHKAYRLLRARLRPRRRIRFAPIRSRGDDEMRTAWFVGLLVASLVALPTAQAAASPAPRGAQTVCIHVHASIKPRPVHLGDDMFINSDWENCGRSAYMRFVFAVRARASCEQWRVRDDFHYRLGKGEGFGEGIGGQVDCKGDYRVTAKAYHDGALIGRASSWVRVLP